MYEVKEKTVKLTDGVELTTFSRVITSANILEVEAGTNGYQGGDSGHGSRTYFKIKDMGGTDITVNKINGMFGDDGFEVILGGDCELNTMIRALKFITKVLEDQANNVDD